MRFSAKFLQYANAGDEVAVTVIPSAIGRSAVRVMFSLHTPSGKPAGRVAASEKKVTKPTLLLAERNNPASGEVWSVRVNSAVDDYNIAVLGDSVPVLSATPDSVFQNR